MARPPRAPLSRSSRTILAVFALSILVTGGIAYYITYFTDIAADAQSVAATETVAANLTPAAGSTATAGAVASATAAVATPAGDARALSAVSQAASPTVPPATATPKPPATPASCDGACLVRLADDDATRAALAERGVIPAYAHGGQLWAAADGPTVDALRAGGATVTVAAEKAETLPLLVVRAAEGEGDGVVPLVEELGETVDRVGDQFVVRAAQLPPPVRALTDAGAWVEKFPPLPASPEPSVERDERSVIGAEELGGLAAAVDGDRLEATIADLQGMSSTDGTGIGTRHYTTPGNVMAAEYLYSRFAELGAAPRYEDFITGDGLLALNVVAELPGDDPSQVFLVLGHFDSINDLGQGQGEAPGADDNASGIAAMLEIARLLADHRLAHPVRFFATNVEEVGLQGVQAFAERARQDGTAIVGAYNIDAVGSYQHGTQLVLNGDADSAYLQDLLIELNDSYGLGQSLLVRQNPVIVADDNYLRSAGFPTILVARELYGWSRIVHTPGDTLDTVDLENVRSCTQLVLLAVATLVGEE